MKCKIRSYVLPVLFVSMLMLESCNNNDFDDMDASFYSYIDIDINNPENFNAEDYSKLREAEARMEKYIKVQNNQLKVTVLRGEDIAMSDRLFSALVNSIHIVNRKLSNGELFLYDKKLLSIEDVTLNTMPRVKSEGNESGQSDDSSDKPETEKDYGYFGWTETTTFNQEQAMEYWEEFNESNTTFATIMGVAALGTSFMNQMAGFSFAAMSLMEHLERSGAADSIYNAAKNGPITVETYMDYTTGSMNTSVYDHKGNPVSSVTYGSTGWF